MPANRTTHALTIAVFIICSHRLHSQEISFQRQVRGILSDKCFRCHGPDANDRQAGLRLDVESGAKSELDSGTRAVVPGNVAHSELISRIISSDEDLVMPPANSGKSLTAKEVDILKQWVAEGANWEQHWAFTEISRPTPPETEHPHRVGNDIDRFIHARLADKGLRPVAEADRVSLIRRITLDLTGLPPTISEVDDFLRDGSPDAYARVVDRLLSSQHYGEHMSRFWLDAARYGDTHGLHLDNYREMWAYRDWVIDAFNDNKPFDEFTIEQLAGDLLDNPSDDQRIATGFNRCHVTTSEGGSIAEEVHVRNVVDRVVTTGTVFMGLTMDCTRCHDHKFDPITMKEFYSFYAYFNSIEGPPLDGNRKDPAPVMKVMSSELKSRIAGLRSKQADADKRIREYLANIRYKEPANPKPRVLPEPSEFVWVDDSIPAGAKPEGSSSWKFESPPSPVFSGQTSHVGRGTGLSQHFFTGAQKPLEIADNDTFFCYVYLDPVDPPKEIMLQWNDGNWNHRAYWGGDHIDWGKKDSPERLRLGDLPAAGEWIRLDIDAADVGFKKGSLVNGWAFTQFGGTVYWDKAGIVSMTQRDPLYESFAVWKKDQSQTKGEGLPEKLRPLVARSDLSETEISQLRDYFLEYSWTESQKTVAPLRKQFTVLKTKADKLLNDAPTTLIFKESKKQKAAYLLNRGEYDQKGDQVKRGTPSALPPLPKDAPQDRMGLARWLVSDKHPLTSRVTANRMWQQFFGTGLVKTAEDFGSQGESPTHPLLLDWLASEFMHPQTSPDAHRWDVKHLVRLIVMSSTYRQTAQVFPETYEIDPDNRFLARGPRFRLDAETLRDQALAVSGLLNLQVGGPSVKPPQPDGLWFAVGFSGSDTVRFKKDNGTDKVHRRTLYTFIKRTAPAPQMSTFDAPSRESCIVRRERTNSPMQALLLMNDPQYVECARGLAERTMVHGGRSLRSKAGYLLKQCVLRNPQADELEGLVECFQENLSEYQANPDSAKQLISIGEEPPNSSLDVPEFAAWTMVANLVLNLDEVINK